MIATPSGWYPEMSLIVDPWLFVMTFTESDTIEQMILEATAKFGDKPSSVRRCNTRLAELA
jgi:hypothetical protein